MSYNIFPQKHTLPIISPKAASLLKFTNKSRRSCRLSATGWDFIDRSWLRMKCDSQHNSRRRRDMPDCDRVEFSRRLHFTQNTEPARPLPFRFETLCLCARFGKISFCVFPADVTVRTLWMVGRPFPFYPTGSRSVASVRGVRFLGRRAERGWTRMKSE